MAELVDGQMDECMDGNKVKKECYLILLLLLLLLL